MRKLISILLIIIIFLVGIKIGSSSSIVNSSNDLFEQAKDDFENEIVIPDNDYENIDLKPKEYLPNKIARKISSILEKLIDKIA